MIKGDYMKTNYEIKSENIRMDIAEINGEWTYREFSNEKPVFFIFCDSKEEAISELNSRVKEIEGAMNV